MSDEDLARTADAEHVSLKLAQGLKACRSVVADYRSLLGGEANDNFSHALVETDQPRETDDT